MFNPCHEMENLSYFTETGTLKHRYQSPTAYSLKSYRVQSLAILGRTWIKSDRIWIIKENTIRIEKVSGVVQSNQTKSLFLEHVTFLLSPFYRLILTVQSDAFQRILCCFSIVN